jgi:hypothetical protein
MKTILTSFLLCLLVVFVGCSQQSRRLEAQSPPPTGIELLRTAKVMLEGCIHTGERGKELENGDQIVASLRSTHPKEADALEKGFAELRSVTEKNVKATAQKILSQLGEID